MKRFITLFCTVALAACGGSGNGSNTPSTYSLGGSINGLGGASGLLLANGNDFLVVDANATRFTFGTTLLSGSSYNVSVSTQPAGLYCQVNGGAGTMGSASAPAITVQCAPPTALALLAGSLGGPGSFDGIGAAARFTHLGAIATDAAGTVYVADSGGYTIRKITPAGLVSTLAGTSGVWGSADGVGAAARFGYAQGIATDTAGNIYVADSDNGTIRKVTSTGVVSTLAGSAGEYGSTDGTGAAARFGRPQGIATDTAGNVYVADAGGNNTVRKITPAGVVSTLAGTAGVAGSADGSAAVATFQSPGGIATDSVGNVYVADTDNHTVRKITPGGVVSTLAGSAKERGSADGTGAQARLTYPQGLATDSAGNVYVADTYNQTIRKITPAGVASTVAGTANVVGSADGVGAAAGFAYPEGVATDSAGNIYVADSGNGAIRTISPTALVSRLAGSTGYLGMADRTSAAGRFKSPAGITTDSVGNVYLVDSSNFRLSAVGNTIHKITPAGLVSTLAGNAGVYGSTDGLGTVASFQHPKGIAADSVGNVYVADTNAGTIRKITPAGLVSTLAGTAGIYGNADGVGTAASFRAEFGIASDSADNLYVADYGAIRKITPAGVVSTVAGTVGVLGNADGVGAAAGFGSISGIATDSAGTLYVTDGGAIRKVTPSGLVSTLAGSLFEGGNTDGVGTAARFQYPTGIATDSAGNVYVADGTVDSAIRKITPAGVVSTIFALPVRLPVRGLDFEPIHLAIRGNTLYISVLQGVGMVNLP